MAVFVALLRAVNVGGTGKLPMADLVKLCEKAGLQSPKTYIQSGNVVFGTKGTEAKVKATLEKALTEKLGKPAGVLVRTGPELRKVLADNPFKEAAPNRVLVMFLDTAPPKDSLEGVATPAGERLALGAREIYIHYPEGQGTSKLKVPFSKEGTARNLNTIAKLAEMAEAHAG
ncbi:MAG: DUF1697 domain-containing protein [Polyangiaceae bacterium]